MASLIQELQAEALDSTKSATDLLRKALVVAKKLAVKDFETWITGELNGYSKINCAPPEYRKVFGEIKAYNPYNNYWMPIVIDDTKIALKIQSRYMLQPLSALESLLRQEGEKLTWSFPPEVERMLCDGQDGIFTPKLIISANSVHAMIDTVRNTVLQWALNLEEEGILGEGLSFTTQEKEKAKANPNINIHNFQGILGNVSSSNISQDLKMSIQTNDFKSLAEFLKANSISTEDISELEKAIHDDPKPESPKSLGERVSSWIGNMISKAASGAWQMSVSAASTLLTNAISAYYGFMT